MSEVFKEYESVHALPSDDASIASSRSLQRIQTSEPSPGSSQLKNSCTVLTLEEVRSDVLGVTDASAVIGHEANQNTC